MMNEFGHYVEFAAKILESVGVITIAGGGLFIILRFLYFYFRKETSVSYVQLRQQLGKAILLGLEILVAADIIATVSTEPTMQSVLVLGVVVLIRTFLSFSLQVELEGKWPWQDKNPATEKRI